MLVEPLRSMLAALGENDLLRGSRNMNSQDQPIKRLLIAFATRRG